MRAGRLRSKVTVQRRDVLEDDFSHGDAEWSDLIESPADIRPMRGDELARAQQMYGTTTHKVTVRYHATLGPIQTDWRLLFNGRVFDIVYALNTNERNRWQELLCRESTGGDS